MQINQVIAVTTVLVAIIVSVVVYMNYAAGGDGHHWDKSKWSVTMADGTTTQTWWVDLNQGIKISTLAADQSSTFTQEFIGDKQYQYFSQGSGFGTSGFDCDQYGGVPAGVSCTDLKAQLAIDVAALSDGAITSSCTVSDANISIEQVTVKDGSLNVGGFIVTVANGKPTSIVSGDGALIATITSVETYSEDVAFGGCAANADRHVMEKLEESHARRLASGVAMSETEIKARAFLDASYMEMIPGAKDAASARQLSAWTDFQANASGTKWCGGGTDMVNTPCPNSAMQGDFYCYRHDHGAKCDSSSAMVKLGCDIDNSLAWGTNNFMAQAIFGAWGLAQTWGCSEFGSYDCWAWFSTWVGGYWWYGSYCHGESTRSGPSRYNSNLLSCPGFQGAGCSFQQRWGFTVRKRCSSAENGPKSGYIENNPNNGVGFFWGKNCPTGVTNVGGYEVCK